jgi:hypothetical protein
VYSTSVGKNSWAKPNQKYFIDWLIRVRENKQVIYETLLNEHILITNQISDIKANSYELNESEKNKVIELQKRQVELMNRMKTLFNGNFGN